MSGLVRGLGVALLSTLAACGRRDRPPPDRPSQPTLSVAPDPRAPSSGRRVVAVGQIAQPWHVGAFSPASVTLSDVAAGDAIVVLGVFWGDLEAGDRTAPTDDRGVLQLAVDHGPSTVGIGRKKPPVFAQLYVELDAAPGPHTIVPAYLGGPAGDGTLYVAQIRGLTERRVIGVGHSRVKGDAIGSIAVTLAGAAQAGDLVIAVGGYDNTEPRDQVGWSPLPPGWIALGAQDDASNNVPSSLCYRVAATPGPQSMTWRWTDPKVNIVAAALAVLR
jgi:hypothetical protein